MSARDRDMQLHNAYMIKMIEGSLIFGELDGKKQNNYTNQTNAYILVLFLTSLIIKAKICWN